MAKRTLLFLLGLVCLLTVGPASAQWLEGNVILPDSLGGVVNPRCIACNTANGTVYVSGQEGERTVVIDGNNSLRLAHVPTSYFAIDMCYNPTSDKVYVVGYYDNTLTIIDCATNERIAAINTGWGQ